MAYHLFKKLQKVSSKESKPKNENRNEDIDTWLRNVHDVVDKDVIENDSNETYDNDVVDINNYLTTLNNIIKYTEKVKTVKSDDLDNENTIIAHIKQFCKILNIIHVLEKLKKDNDNDDKKKKKNDILTKNNAWDLFEEIILNSSEILNKIVCLNKDMFHKKSLRIDCNKLKRYVNYLNTLFKETNNCDLLFSIFYFEFENPIFVMYELVLLLQKMYIYDNINFYFYLYDNIVYSDNVSSSYYYNLYSLKCFQILYSEFYSESNVNLKEQSDFVRKLYEQYMLIINRVRKGKLLYVHYVNFPFNYSDEKIIYKNKNEKYYINEKKEFYSIPTNKKFSSSLFFDEDDDTIKKNLKKLQQSKKLHDFIEENDSCVSSSVTSDLDIGSDYSGNTFSVANHGSNETEENGQGKGSQMDNRTNEVGNTEVKVYSAENCLGSVEVGSFRINDKSASSSDESKENCDFFSSDVSSNFLSVNEEFDDDKKSKKIKICEENFFLIMFRRKKIETIRSTIDRLILNKNNFICKLLSIIDSNEDAYLINEIILLFLLISDNNIEIKNIITYERIIETIMKIIKEEHHYLFKETVDLFFLYHDTRLDTCIKTKVFSFANKRAIQEKRKNREYYTNDEKRETYGDVYSQKYRIHGEENMSQNVLNRKNNKDSEDCTKGENEYGKDPSDREIFSFFRSNSEMVYIQKLQKKNNENENYNDSSCIDEGNMDDDRCIHNFVQSNVNNEEDGHKIEIYLDNISINIDIKSSLLLLKCLIINSEFGLKYIYELNILEEFIKLTLNLYNIIIYIFKNSLSTFYNNSIFIINIFLDIICSICKFHNKSNCSDISLKKLVPIFQKTKFIESSFFFFFKFIYIYMHKMVINCRKSLQQILLNNGEYGQVKNESLSNYDTIGETQGTPELSRMINSDINCGTKDVNVKVSTNTNNNEGNFQIENNKAGSVHLSSNLAGSSHLSSNKAGSVHLSSNIADSAHLSSNRLSSLPPNSNHESSSSHFKESDYVFEVFKNTNLVNILNICCKFIYQDEKYCNDFLCTNFDVTTCTEGEETNMDVHIEEYNFIMASFKKQNYFYLEHVLAFYLKKLKQVKYVDMLLILLFWDNKNIIQKGVYEFFMCLCEKYVQVSKYINLCIFTDNNTFHYCIVHTVYKLKKRLSVIKKWYYKNRLNSNNIVTPTCARKIDREVLFFFKYIRGIEFLHKICSLISVNNEAGGFDKMDAFLQHFHINFDEIVYYNSVYVNTYRGGGKYFMKRVNNHCSINIFTFKINVILYGKKIDVELQNIKYLINLINNKYIHTNRKVKCLICVYICIYLFKSKNENVKKEIIKLIMKKNIFNILYNHLNHFCKYTFDEKYFFFPHIKSKHAEEHIKNVSVIRKKKYFFYYSCEKSLYFIHFIYSNYIHHDMLTYFFEQTKNPIYQNDMLCNDILPIKKKSYSMDKSNKRITMKMKTNEQKGKWPKCETSEKEANRGQYNNQWMDNRDEYKKNDAEYDEYSEVLQDGEDEEEDWEEVNNSENCQRETHFAYIEGEEGRDKQMKKWVESAVEEEYSGRKENRWKKYEGKKEMEKRIRARKMSMDISNLRNKFNELEMKHIEEKIYLNKIIEKKNDIINNILYSYLLLKEKFEKIEEENVMLNNTLCLKEKEHEIMISSDMNKVKKDHIQLLEVFEKTNMERICLENKLDKLTDLLLFLYDNVNGCSQYMQNIENISFFKNVKVNDQDNNVTSKHPNNETHEDSLHYGGTEASEIVKQEIYDSTPPHTSLNMHDQAHLHTSLNMHDQAPLHTSLHMHSQTTPHTSLQMYSHIYFDANRQMESYSNLNAHVQTYNGVSAYPSDHMCNDINVDSNEQMHNGVMGETNNSHNNDERGNTMQMNNQPNE
ncbi:conserved Plasmodium protein, unknown function [Plasmodium ovale]|uniref:Uncharacterized protein n=2 Tax=Plasmodium ovale TaxID=36330 RepID=A0A1A8VJT6_PLAOA|nr:conserved Plasmodium protein, unknown function [Plasmodium ovale curtisi]SBS80352.1 conserved Plasmodium protein, unknown function [Plasmodium ovale curtisi]SCD22330.1 conserved Plasmodium protein, unknown function [Plasmodium ovale]